VFSVHGDLPCVSSHRRSRYLKGKLFLRQFLVDGECIDVEEGSVRRINPPAA
jgi:hypothetical protein